MPRQTDERNKTENPETDLYIYYQIIYNNGNGKAVCRNLNLFNK